MLLIEELKRRNVFRVGIAYVVTAWLVIQVAETIFPLFGFDKDPARVVVIIFAIGFLPTLVFAWVFELTPDGLQKESAVDRNYVAPAKTTKMLDRVILLVLALALGYFAFDKFVLDPARDEMQVKSASERAVQDALEGVSRFDSLAPSIAVLPFASLSSDPEQEYFADGLSEEILNLLTKIDDLKVIARTSSFAFRDKNEDARRIGEVLGVKTLLNGSVRKSGEQVRITAALIDASDGSRIWSETYERKLTDIFAVQEAVAAAIIGALQVHVDANPTRGRPTENTEAYALFLRARIALNTFGWDEAEEFLLQAIELDPDFAEAYELLSFCYWKSCGGPVGMHEGRRRVYEFASKALAIDPELALAEALYIDGKMYDYGYLDRLDAFERAAQKEPTNANLLEALAWDLSLAGYMRKALDVAERYLELDPISLPANNQYWRALYGVGRTDEAFAAMDIYEQLGGDNSPWVRGRLNLNAGQDDNAIANFEAQLEQEGFTDTSWVREVVTGARDSANGQAYLDRRIPEIAASMPEEDAFEWQETLSRWYLHFGFLDRYFDLIPDPATDTGNSVWTDIETPVEEGTMIRHSGFTAHPRYLHVAEAFGFIETWEQRGPPDFCKKTGDEWICE
jgi:adenylate cyclase